LKKSIQHFITQLIPFLPFPSVVLDVYVAHPPLPSLTVPPQPSLIELNPYFGDLTSGGCLFDWEADKSILMSNGEVQHVPLRIRVGDDRGNIEFEDR
jgi:hypothetical protein